MADFEKVNDVATSSIEKVNDIAKSSIQNINGMTVPASGATLWVAGINDCYAGFATTDLTSWTTYDARSTGATPDFTRVGYGKDGSGNPIWVGTWLADNAEVNYTSDPTDSNHWTAVQNDSSGSNLRNRKHALKWGNDVWVAIGSQSGSYKNYFRSTDGQAWTQVDCSGYTDFNTTQITALATDGAGTWWFAQQCRIYKSTNNASSFSLYHTITGCGEIDDLAYTNSTLVAIANGVVYAEVAANSSADFSSGTDLSASGLKRMAASGGRVVAVNGKKAWYFDVSGKTISNAGNSDNYPQVGGSDITGQCIGTDGTTWLVGCIGGHIVRSTDNGETWAVIVSALSSGGSAKDIEDIKPNIYLPL